MMAEPGKWRLSRAGMLGALIFGLTTPLGWKPSEGIAYNAGYTTGGLLVGFGLFAAAAALRNLIVGAKS